MMEARCTLAGTVPDVNKRIEIRNPADIEECVGTFPRLPVEAGDTAVEAAYRTLPTWRQLRAVDRAALVTEAAEAIAKLTYPPELIVREQGKVLREAEMEPMFFAYLAAYYAGMAAELDAGTVAHQDDAGKIEVYADPVGVVVALTPWNAPLTIAAAKVIPALIAGCTVVLKPSPVAPLAALSVFGEMASCLPAGVLSVITGPDPDLSQRLVTHPLVGKVSFTGSVRTGVLVAQAAAATLKRVTLELGGNDAALVLDDAPIDETLCKKLAEGAFMSTGQICMGIKRVYAPRHRVGDLADGIRAVLDGFVVGNGLDPETTVGPLTTKQQRERVRGLVDSARQAGATVSEHGDLRADPERGWFMRPAVATGLAEDHPLVAEEQFGPALPIQPYDDIDQAIAMANATDYGLTASIWTSDFGRGEALARLLEVGSTFVNSHGYGSVHINAPFGGRKLSGLGREFGREALLSYTETHMVNNRPA